jgi:glycosyltransferase involved in cell wall biosynthesis
VKPVLLVTGQVPPDRVCVLQALHAAEGIEVAIYDGRLHHATAGVTDPGVPFRRVRPRAVHALAAAGAHRAVIATSAGRVALPAAYTGARRAGIPFLWWTGIWAPIRTPAHLAGAPLMRAIERGADATIAYGPHVAAFARARGARNVHVAPHAVDAGFWSVPGDGPRARAALGDPPFLALFAGRDAPGKGLGVLLEAWERSGLHGDGGLLALAGASAGAPGVRPLGALAPADLRDFYAAADVVVVPSVPTRAFREPWALVVNEAMHQSVPVIATDAVGAAAGGLVRDGETGRVVAAGEPGALADALRTLRADPAERARLGAAGHAAVAAYTPQAWAAAVSAALASVSAGRGEC